MVRHKLRNHQVKQTKPLPEQPTYLLNNWPFERECSKNDIFIYSVEPIPWGQFDLQTITGQIISKRRQKSGSSKHGFSKILSLDNLAHQVKPCFSGSSEFTSTFNGEQHSLDIEFTRSSNWNDHFPFGGNKRALEIRNALSREMS